MTDFFISTEAIEWGPEARRNTITVRGLSFEDFTVLFSQFGKETDKIFQFIESLQESGKADFDAKAFGAELIASAPKAVASLIALAADMPDRATQVARMPLPVQIRALEAIYRMTVEEAGGIADFLAQVTRIAKGVSQTTHLMSSRQNEFPLSNTGT